MPETRFPALSIHPRIGISLSALKTDDRVYLSAIPSVSLRHITALEYEKNYHSILRAIIVSILGVPIFRFGCGR